MQSGGISFLTIEPIVITDPLPIVYPGPIIDFAPTHTWDSILIGLQVNSNDDFLKS